MLYINTKNKNQTYTAHQVLFLDHTDDGGMIAPIRLPYISESVLSDIFNSGFIGATNTVLNKFFSKAITEEQLKEIISDDFPSADMLDRKTLLIRFNGQLTELEKSIFTLLSGIKNEPPLCTKCIIRISLLFGMFSDLFRCGIHSADFAVISDNVLSLVPVLYGKIMGLPINKIIVGSSSENAVWNYLHKGPVASDDAYEYFKHGIVDAENKLLCDVFSYVVSNDRAKEIVSTIHSTYKKTIDMPAAFSYGALQDYRSLSGENRTTIIFNNN